MARNKNKNSNSFSSRRSGDKRRETIDGGQFRRNRAFVGSRYKAQEDDSPRSKMHRLSTMRRKAGLSLLVVLIISAVLFALLSQFTARVSVSATSAAISQPIEMQRYEQIISDYLAANPASRLRFALNEAELSKYASGVAPEIESIAQSGSMNMVETSFTVSLRRPVAGWQINGKQYFVDQHGIVFERNYYGKPSVQIIDDSGISPEQGSAVTSSRFLSFVGRVVALSREGGYTVSTAVLPAGTTRQLRVSLKDVSPSIVFSIDRGAGEQVEDMIRALEYLRSKKITAQYVDVRVSGQAVYK